MCHRSLAAASGGLTMVELCLVLALLAALALAAWPGLADLLQRRALLGLADELRSDLHRARAEAVARRLGVWVTAGPAAGGSCWVAHVGDVGACRCAGEAPPVCEAPGALIVHRFVDARTGLAVSSSVAALRFDPDLGTATPAGTLRVVAGGGASIHHVVNLAGRVRSCVAGPALPGVPAC